MNIEQTIKEIIAEIKKVDFKELNFTPDLNFIKKINLNSLEVVNFVDKLDKIFEIDFGSESADFDSLKSWSALLSNVKDKINIKKADRVMEKNILSLFYQSFKKYPNKVAVQFFSEKLTYKQLHDLSDQIAIKIIAQKIQPNSPIILEVEKSLVPIVYILGILKAGCYYIPVASSIPINRLKYLFENSECHMAFLHNYYDQLSNKKDLNCFLIEKDLSKLMDPKSDSAIRLDSLQIKATDPVCCLYTSGSTGYPKGVLVSHAGIATFFQIIKPCMNINHKSICLNTAPFIFDVSIIDALFPLTMGATIHISPEIILPNIILKMIQQYHISHMSGVSSTINLLFGNAELLKNYDISSLTTVMTGAELLRQKTLYNLLKYSPSATIINGYGLTETTCVCIAFIINGDNVNNYLLYPIGKPLPGVEAKILSANGAEDNRGELLLRSDLIMLRYLNNPDATNKAFIDYEGKTYFRTGDIVSYDKDQNFIFHGRNDTQVKINGYRIDLNEIKYTLLTLKTVKEVEVFTLEATIAAVLSLVLESEVSDEEKIISDLKSELDNLLPRYMHPTKWGILKDLPKLSTGKSDLKKLRLYFDYK